MEDYSYGVAALNGRNGTDYDYKSLEIYRPKSKDNKEGKIIDYTQDAKKWKKKR